MSYEQVTVADGKYTVQIGVGAHAGHLNALRHGEPWQDLTGNNLVYWLAVELRDARAELKTLDVEIKKVPPRYATEINRLRNVIQAACTGGLEYMIERWKVLFPDEPVPTVQAPAPAQRVPSGFKLAPKRPSENALAGARHAYRNATVYDVLDVWNRIWEDLPTVQAPAVGADDARDAARYRWLRDGQGVNWDVLPVDAGNDLAEWRCTFHSPYGMHDDTEDNLDAAVDDAMAAQGVFDVPVQGTQS